MPESTMWWINLLLTITVTSGASLQRDRNETYMAPIQDEIEDVSYFKSELEKLSRNFLESFSAAHSFEKSNRRKRAVLSPNSTLLSGSSEIYRLQAVKPLFSMCSSTVEIKLEDVDNVTYAACVSASYASAHLGYVTRDGWHSLVSWKVRKPVDVDLFHDKGLLYVLVADSRNEDGIELVKYNISSNEKSMDHVVHSTRPTAVALWKMRISGQYHMAVANSAGNEAEDLSSKIYTYYWTGTYFDNYASILAYDVRDIEPFHIHGASYLAVANYRKGEGNYFVDSEIFRYSYGGMEDKEKWVSHQKIRTYGALNWEFFSLGSGTAEEFFLAVANYALYDPKVKVGSVIYKYVKDIFVPFQCLQTVGATSIAAYSKGATFLLAVAGDDGVAFYQYDGWRFVISNSQFTQATMSSGVKALTFHTLLSPIKTLILAVSNSESRYASEYNVYEMTFVGENFLQSWYDRSSEWCAEKLDRLQSTNTDAMFELNSVFFVDQKDPIIVDGNLFFDSGFEAAKLSTSTLKEITSGILYDDEILFTMKSLNRRLMKLAERIEAVSKILNAALKIEGIQNISASYVFSDVSFLCEHQRCTFDNVTTEMLNGEDVAFLKDNVIFLDSNVQINAPISVESVAASDIFVYGLVGGKDLNEVVTKHGNHTITAHKEFSLPIFAKSVDVRGLVDGVLFFEDTVLLTSGEQSITGKLSFADITAGWLEVTGLINGIDFTKFCNDVILSNGSYRISGIKNFADVVVEDLKLSFGSVINGVDIEDTWSHVLWKTGVQEITAPFRFSSIALTKNIVVKRINNIVPASDLLLVNQSVQIFSNQEFHKFVRIGHLKVKNSINGISVDPYTGELDILRRNGQQTIAGQKSFKAILLNDNSYVSGLVDGIDLYYFHRNAARNDVPLTADTWTFNNLRIEGPLEVDGTVLGLDVRQVYDRALKLNETILPNYSSVVFQQPISVHELESSDINGIDVRNYLMLVNEPQVVRGMKSFNVITLKDNSSIGRINNISLSFLNSTLLQIGNQMINSKKINGNIRTKKLLVMGLLNGVSIDEVVFLDTGSILGSKRLSNVLFSELSVKVLDTNGLVNGIDVQQMMEDTLTYDGSQYVYGKKTVRGLLRLPSGSNLQTDNLNGLDLSELYRDAVLVDQAQEISGNKYFMASVTFDNLHAGYIDGVSEEHMNSNWMLQGVDQTVESNVRFHDINAVNVFIERHINNVNLTELNETMIKIGESAVIEGPTVFHGKVISTSDVTLTGTVQGIDISEAVVLRSKESDVSSKKMFSGDLTVNDLIIMGLVDGVSIQDVCKNTIFLNDYQVLNNLIIEGDVIITSGFVKGTFTDVDVESLFETMFSLQGGDSFINGFKFFESLTIEGALTVMGKFGETSLSELLNNYMSCSRSQKIIVEHIFSDIYANSSLTAANLFAGSELVNGIDIKHMDQKLLRTTGHQLVEVEYGFGEIVFEDDIFVVGRVNGIEIPKGLMQRNRTNYIKSPKVFKQSIVVVGDLDVADGRTVQGTDVSHWFSRSVKNDGSVYNIRASKAFANLKTNDIRVKGLVDGLNISEDTLLLSYGDQIITGEKTIHNDVDIYGSLTVASSINGINVVDLASRVVRKNRSLPITSVKTFKQPLRIEYLQADLIDGVNVTSLRDMVNADVDYESLKMKLEEMDDVIREMQDSFESQAVLFQYYELFQVFDLPLAYSWLYVFAGNRDFLLLSDFTELETGCTAVRTFQYNPAKNEFQLMQDLISSKSKAMTTFEAWQYTLVVVSNSVRSPCFDRTTAQTSEGYGSVSNSIYLYDVESNRFKPYQTLWTSPIADVVSFVDDDVACFLLFGIADAVVYCANNLAEGFLIQERLPTTGGRKATISRSEDATILVVASVDVLHYSSQQSVNVYIWNSAKKSFGNPVQVIKVTHADSVLLMSHKRYGDSETLLLVAEGSVPRINNAPRIYVYRLESGFFYKVQEIRDYGKLDWVELPSNEPAFFALDPRSGRINIYVHKGVSGFLKYDSITSVGTVNFHAFTRRNSVDKNHYIALAGPRSIISDVWEDRDRAKILKSKTIDGRPAEFY